MTAKKILVVEDELMLTELIKFRLEAKGYLVSTAENGKEGILKALSEKPDLIIADLMMPELDGISMIGIIRSNSDLKKVPIVVISALGREEDIKKAKDAGADDYIVKPYSTDEFITKIENHLK